MTHLRTLASLVTALCCSALFLAVPAQAAYSGLVIIPTGDLLEANHLCLTGAVDGNLAIPATEKPQLWTEYGINDVVEIGADFDLRAESDPFIVGNLKYQMLAETANRPALAIGVFGLAKETQATTYAVATKDLNLLRAHVGVQRLDGIDRWFIGADRTFADRWTVMADYISGEENTSSVGVNYEFAEDWGLLVGTIFPNAGGDAQFTLQVGCTVPFFEKVSEKE